MTSKSLTLGITLILISIIAVYLPEGLRAQPQDELIPPQKQPITILNPTAELGQEAEPGPAEPILSKEEGIPPWEENSIRSGPPSDELTTDLGDTPLPDSRIGQSLATYNLTDGLVLWMHFNNEQAYGEGGIELPNNQADSYVNMTGNVLLMHFNNDSSYGENDTHVYDFSGLGNNGTVYGSKV